MKLFRMIGHSIRDGIKSVCRNFSLSLASISCITITLVIVAIAILASYNVDNFTKLIKKDVTAVVFLNTDITETEVKQVETKIKRISNVDTSSVEYESKQQILENFKDTSDILQNIMSSWEDGENPLKPTFQVKVNDLTKIKETVDEIKKIDGVEVVKYGEGMVEKLITTFDVVEKITFGVVIALIFVTAFLISNTIKLTISARKREIEIMRLVGASNFFIKLPFIIEGLFLGLLGAVIPIAATIYGYTFFYDTFEGNLFSPIIKLISPTPFVYLVSLLLAGIGILVGMFGSSRAVRKFLKI